MDDALTLTRARLAALWDGRDLRSVASPGAAGIPAAAGDWDPPQGIEPLRPPLSLSIGIPDSDALPRTSLVEAMQKVLASKGDSHLRYAFGQGYLPIRSWLAHKYQGERGRYPVDAEWFQITHGGSEAIDLCVRALIAPGDVIMVESPTYVGTLGNFRAAQAEVHSVSVDHEGLRVDELAARVRELKRLGKRVKLLYTISALHNPTSVTLSEVRRRKLLALAAEEDFLILDDDVYGDLHYDTVAPPRLGAMAGGRGVITIGSFSKVLATGLRVGWVCAHPDLIQLIAKMRFSMGPNPMVLQMVGNFLAAGELEPHVAKMRVLYKAKMQRLASVLRQDAGKYLSFDEPAGGFSLWVALKAPLTAKAMWRTAMHEGVQVNPGYAFFADRVDPSGEHLRLTYAWTPLAELDEAARRIATACERVANGRGA